MFIYNNGHLDDKKKKKKEKGNLLRSYNLITLIYLLVVT